MRRSLFAVLALSAFLAAPAVALGQPPTTSATTEYVSPINDAAPDAAATISTEIVAMTVRRDPAPVVLPADPSIAYAFDASALRPDSVTTLHRLHEDPGRGIA